ncbi:lipoprotein localization factor LolB, partial [Candidatus Palibaumannia cicadellinicola]
LPGQTNYLSLDKLGYLYQIDYSNKCQYWTVTYNYYHTNIVPALPAN